MHTTIEQILAPNESGVAHIKAVSDRLPKGLIPLLDELMVLDSDQVYQLVGNSLVKISLRASRY